MTRGFEPGKAAVPVSAGSKSSKSSKSRLDDPSGRNDEKLLPVSAARQRIEATARRAYPVFAAGATL
jgi:hypothetical protein